MFIKAISAAVCGLMFAIAAMPSQAYFIEGSMFCDVNQNQYIDGNDLPLANVAVLVTNTGGTLFTDASNADGYYNAALPVGTDSYVARLSPTNLPLDTAYVIPASGQYEFSLDAMTHYVERHWLINSSACGEVAAKKCWLTAGGVKFAPEVVKGPVHNFGGNVFPSCNSQPGRGGQWNHVAHSQNLRFLGTDITQVACGNVPGIVPGSTSPVTPYNFIHFRGTGTLRGIKGNNADYGTVHFFARAEDRGEPGSQGGTGDRYMLHVYSNPADPVGSTLLLVDQDANPGSIDPVVVTGGNLQLHISSCDNPPN